jgi:hypothetical protein
MLLATSLFAVLAALTAASPTLEERGNSIDAYVVKEKAIAFNSALANIGGTKNTRVPAANPGIVAASPSNVFPNCERDHFLSGAES